MSQDQPYRALAMLASDTPRAQEAAQLLADKIDWAPLDQADAVVVLGGDGFMLQSLHQMLDSGRVVPAYGINLGTVGFLMNRFRNGTRLLERVNKSRAVAVDPLRMEAHMRSGASATYYAINEVSLLRETRQTAKIEVSVNEKVRIARIGLRRRAGGDSCRVDRL